MRFEEVVKHPEHAAAKIAQVPHPEKMTAAVVPRKGRCAYGMLETTLARVGPPAV